MFKRVSDAELRQAGFDPHFISPDEGDGPYTSCRVFDRECPCCGAQNVSAWTVVNLETAVGHSQDWLGDEGEVDAGETASMLNAAWTLGRRPTGPT